MPNEKAAEPLSEEKLARLESMEREASSSGRQTHNAILALEARNALPSLLAEVRLGREALGILEDMVDAGPYTATEGESDLRLIAKSVLRKAGLR